MKQISLFIAMFMMSCTGNLRFDAVSYVNPFIGTDYVGNTYPGAQTPFGMVQLSPDNGLPGWDRISGYFYPDSTIAGFSHTHLQGTGAGDLYDISFMPVTLPYVEAEAPLGIYSKFSHENEYAEAGYYSVLLSDYNIEVELTATPRTGIQRYRFPKAHSAVFLNLAKAMNWDFTRDSEIRVVDSVTICGYRFSEGWAADQKVFFVTRFSRPFETLEIDTSAIFDKQTKLYCGKGCVARFDFDTFEGEELILKTAISGVDIDGAFKNLKQEAPHWNFDVYRKNARELWNDELSKIEVTGGSYDQKVNLYTALYRAFSTPTLFCDVDGRYCGTDKKIHVADGWENYSTFSLWDTYRAEHPLLSILQQQRTNDIIESFLAHFDEFGRLPVWSFYGNETDMMIGNHAIPVVVDAYLKNIGNFDAVRALKACTVTSDIDDYRAIGAYKKYGYVPCDMEQESVSKTLEYAFDDWCVGVMAQKLGRLDISTEFLRRSESYKNLFDSIGCGFFRPRLSSGKFLEPFDPKLYTEHITESNAWQYLWSVQHDADGLMRLLGGEKALSAKLDEMFTEYVVDSDSLPIFSTGMIGQYAHGNEPSHHAVYLYNVAGEPWKTQRLASSIMNDFYMNSPNGLCGNEDCGQMSAWFVFSAMGFYPLNPVGGRYEIGSPLFDNVKIHLANGKTFILKAKNLSDKNRYIQSVCLNGKTYRHSFITHEQIMSGATLEFEMGSRDSVCWY